MILNAAEISTLLEMLSYETVIDPTTEFPYKVSKRKFGYSNDPHIGKLQAALSIMLEVAKKRRSR